MARRKRNYTVRTGDTAATIARQLGIDPQTLMQANTGVSNLRAGMVLNTPTPYPTPTPLAPAQTFAQPPQPPMGGAFYERGGIPGYSLQGYKDVVPRIFSPATVAQLGLWQRPAGTKPDPRELFSQYRTSTDLRQQYGDYRSGRLNTIATDLRQQYGDYSGGILKTVGATPTEIAAGGVAGNYIPHDLFQQITRGYGTEGRANIARLAELGRSSYGGIVNVEAADGSIYKVKVRDRGGGDVRYTPVSGSSKAKGRLGYPRRSRRGSGRGGYFLETKEGLRYKEWKKEQKDGDDTSGGAVGSAPRYQPGYNFDYDTRGGYMPMIRQRARPGYLGLINWRI